MVFHLKNWTNIFRPLFCHFEPNSDNLRPLIFSGHGQFFGASFELFGRKFGHLATVTGTELVHCQLYSLKYHKTNGLRESEPPQDGECGTENLVQHNDDLSMRKRLGFHRISGGIFDRTDTGTARLISYLWPGSMLNPQFCKKYEKVAVGVAIKYHI
jgi:hypothetical protein